MLAEVMAAGFGEKAAARDFLSEMVAALYRADPAMAASLCSAQVECAKPGALPKDKLPAKYAKQAREAAAAIVDMRKKKPGALWLRSVAHYAEAFARRMGRLRSVIGWSGV